ncbi:NfrA family protein [Janthinobacterium fluminis]|uniref:Bacteriophage N4 adsorption protein A C-terminal domain-containing protein n=1 Tax=Janthinobacterium fluminis TaxID=2987524 RepID=A0ABT5JZZ9_9BURK|nr:hypothetical protein [Janthinobacterium fluminis]MDC8758289.1 hypothetical protein [Janthinobacterium fluminis]
MKARRALPALALLAAAAAGAQDRALELPLSGPAHRLAQQAYRAYDGGQYATAVAQAREALRLRPDVASLHTLLANALAAQREAHRAAGARPGAKGGAAPAAVAAAPRNPAFQAADLAYKAYNNGDFDAAAASARSAVALAPASSAYRLLLVNTLMAGAHFEQAAAALDAALAAVPDPEGELAARREPIRLRLAEQPVADTYRAMERQDLTAAALAARKAVALAPELVAYRLLLLQVLARAELWDEAQLAASAALALDDNDSALLAMRGYLHQRAGRGAEAQADFERALKQPGLNSGAARSIALIGADAALAAGQPQRAIALLAPYGGKEGEAAQSRLLAARAALARPDAAAPGPLASMPVPELDCRTTPYGQVCTLLPGGPPRDPGYAFASDAYIAIAARQYAAALGQARQAVAASPGRRDYQLVLLAALQAERQDSEAEALAGTLLGGDDADAALLMQRGQLRKRLGRHDAARADFQAAARLRTLGPAAEIALLVELGQPAQASARLAEALDKNQLAGHSDVEIAYLAAGAGDGAGALRHFERADAQALLPAGALQDAAYAAIRAGRNDAAIAYFMRSGDAARDGKLELDAAQRFAVRRAVAELSRNWGVFAALSYRGATALRGIAAGAADTSNDGVQAGAEAYWRPFGSHNGRQFELFARAYATLRSSAGERSGGATLQGSAGARVKPFGESNLFFSLSRLIPLGAATRADWLAQASYFYGAGGDLRADASSWRTTQVSVELGHYVAQPQNYAALSAQFGRTYRFSAGLPHTVLYPHLVLAFDHNSAYDRRNAAGIGPGLTLRHWFRADAYTAPRSYIDITLQYRARLSGDARGKGVFLTAAMSY